jgi:hypothetical protein
MKSGKAVMSLNHDFNSCIVVPNVLTKGISLHCLQEIVGKLNLFGFGSTITSKNGKNVQNCKFVVYRHYNKLR